MRPVAPAILIALLVAGCRTTSVTSDGRSMPPKPVAAPRVPTGATVNAMAVRVGPKATDTDGNGFPDELVVEANLFSEPHPTPLVEWRIAEDALARARLRSPVFGPGHLFRLSLLETGGDSIRSSGVYQINIGRGDGRGS